MNALASSSKHKTTMAKLNRERALLERRELKQAKKDARRRAAAAGTDAPDATDATDERPDSVPDRQS
jgi:hypothetical protein